MILDQIKWDKPIKVNGKVYSSIDKAREEFKGYEGKLEIILNFQSTDNQIENTEKRQDKIYRIAVKQYMTRQSTPQFDFMKKWNNDNPMPVRVMEGEVIQETKGMYKMRLRGVGQPTSHCMRCGKEITNPQSLEYGLGIECIKKVPFPSPVRDINDPDEVKKLMKEVTWEGWVIKSAIIKKKELTREEFDQVAV